MRGCEVGDGGERALLVISYVHKYLIVLKPHSAFSLIPVSIVWIKVGPHIKLTTENVKSGKIQNINWISL